MGHASATGKRALQAATGAAIHVHPPGAGKGETSAAEAVALHVCPPKPWEVCARIAAQQHGVLTRHQLLSAGLSRHVVDGLLRSGGLHSLHRGVYAVGHLALAALATEQAALLACGQPAVLVDRSALYLWGIVDIPPREVHVAVVGHHCRPKSGIRLHLLAHIDDSDVRRRYGLPVTSPARTLIDLAATATALELEKAVAEARVKSLIRDGELERALERAGRRAGAASMRALLHGEAVPAMTRSEAERKFLALLREAQLPQPRSNARIAGYEVDFLWEDEKAIVELDGFQFHSHRRAFERDRRKDMALAAAGYQVIRITWRQLVEEPLSVIAHIARLLERIRASQHAPPLASA